MNRLIDGHVHIRPGHLKGSKDKRFDVNIEGCGKAVFANGRIFRFMPPFFAESAFEADTLIETMDERGVEKAVILQSLFIEINEDIAQAVGKYPDRLKCAMIVDPNEKDAGKQLFYWNDRGLDILKFEMNPVLGFGCPEYFVSFDSPQVTRLLDAAQERNMTVTIDPNVQGGPGYQPEGIKKQIVSHPDTRFVICHLGFARYAMLQDEDAMKQWREMIDLAGFDNVWIDVSAMPDLFKEEGWPYPTPLKMLRDLIDRYGAGKPIFGSDIPGTMANASYSQMIEMFSSRAELTESEKDRLFCLNAIDAYF